MVAQVREPERVEQLEVDLVVRRRDRDLAVGGLEQAVRRHQRVVVAGAQRLLAGLEVVRRRGTRGWRPCCRSRLVATSSPCPVRSRRTSAAQMPIAAYAPAMRSDSGGAARIGGSPSAPLTLMKPLIACAMKSNDGRSRYGPSRPKPVMWQLTMSGLMRCELVARQPDLLHDARAEVVEHDVGGRDELAQHRLALRAAQVERQRPLVAIERREVEAVAVAQDALLAHRVAVVRRPRS